MDKWFHLKICFMFQYLSRKLQLFKRQVISEKGNQTINLKTESELSTLHFVTFPQREVYFSTYLLTSSKDNSQNGILCQQPGGVALKI